SMEVINNEINFDLLHGLFVFFHNRCHGKKQAKESQPSSLPGGANPAYDSSAESIDESELPDINSLSDENISEDRSSDHLIKQNDSASEATTLPITPDALSAPSRIRDLTFIPLSYSQVEQINRMVSEHQKEFGETIIPPMDDFLNQCQREQTVEQVCLQLFNWLQSDWVLRNEDDESPQTLQDAFVNELPTLLYGLAINNENLNLEDESKLRKTVDFKFVRFVRNMGFHLRPENILLLRVKAQIKTFRLAVLGEPQDN
ncbi:hypothetical protein, partial [Endozoicomonas sp. ONNA2]|uniref:hypothetical protein n=1 Tax=Endozoicomonas sp. ONNA2 TaxID=2828741 RepID=UPI0021493CD0